MSDDEPRITAEGLSASIPVSRELLADLDGGGWFVPMLWASLFGPAMTDAERKAAQDARDAERAILLARWRAARDLTGGVLRAILDIHQPDEYGDCRSCSADEWTQNWPCETADLVVNYAENDKKAT